jgi:outer membrane protein TolC
MDDSRAKRSWRLWPFLAWAPLLLGACAPLDRLTRPEGDGGWSQERRREELGRLATAAGADFALASAVPAAASASPSRIDLRTALRIAARRSRRIAEAGSELEISRERVNEARGGLLPAATGSGRYTWYSDPLANRIQLPPALGGASGSQAITIRDSEAGTVNGTATLPLDLSGELRHTMAAAQAGYRGEQARLWATTLAEQTSVVRSYFELLQARRLRAVTVETVTFHHRQLEDAESRFCSGRLTKNELLVVQVALKNSEQELRQRDLGIERARWALNRAMGIEVNAATEPADVEARPELPLEAEALRLAYERNPLVRSLLEEQQRLEETATALARGRLPRFSAGGAIDYTSSDLLQPQQIEAGFVGFAWDLPDARREARISQARLAAVQNRIRIERELRELEAAIRSTRDGADERLSALASAEAAVGQAEENLRIRREQFDAGRATSEDVLDAETLLSSERATLASALYQAHVLRAELQQLIGLPLEEALP